VAEGETVTQSGLKPGMGPMVGVGAIGGRAGTAAAISGATTVVSESFFQTVEADAKRTAKEIADHITAYYKERAGLSDEPRTRSSAQTCLLKPRVAQ
jgi:hypothetical protein